MVLEDDATRGGGEEEDGEPVGPQEGTTTGESTQTPDTEMGGCHGQ